MKSEEEKTGSRNGMIVVNVFNLYEVPLCDVLFSESRTPSE